MTNIVNSSINGKLSELISIGIVDYTLDERLKFINNLKTDLETEKNNSLENNVMDLFKALGNENRISILKLLLKGIKCPCELESILQLSQSTISHHLNILKEVELIKIEKHGKWNILHPAGDIFNKNFLISHIEQIFDSIQGVSKKV